MCRFVIIVSLLLYPAISQSANFTIDGEKVVSKTTEKVTQCDNFSVLIVEESFPAKYETRIPKEFNIPGFYGNDFTIGAEAYFISKDKKYRLPYANEVKGLKELLRKATFIPTTAKCTEHGFYVGYWSGGNGRGSESGINYSVSKTGQLSAPLFFTEDEFLEMYTK
jgi:hypothetical protein